jgi:hypothetical protein
MKELQSPPDHLGEGKLTIKAQKGISHLQMKERLVQRRIKEMKR